MTTEKKRRRIGLLLRGGAYHYQTAIINGAHRRCEVEGVDLYCFAGGLLTGGDPRSFVYQLAGFADLDAVIVVPGTMGDAEGGPQLARLMAMFSEMPLTTIGSKIQAVPAVCVDNASGVRELTRHLVQEHRRRRIAFIGAFSTEARQRQQGYLDGLADCGIQLDDELLFPGNFSPDAGKHAVSALCQGGKLACDAIVCANDWTALGALEELERRGHKVPTEVSLVGFDDIEQARFLTPPLTTIAQAPSQLGSEAVALVLSLLDGSAPPGDVQIPTTPRVRQSCGCFGAPTTIIPSSIRRDGHAAGIESHREQWIRAVAKANCSTIEVLQDVWPKLLVDAFIKDLKSSKREAFLATLSEIVAKSAHLGNITAWHAAVGTMRKSTVAQLVDQPEQWLMAESIFEQAHILVGDQAERTQARRRLEKEALLRDLELMSAEVRTALDDLSLQHAVASHLPRLKIPSAFVVAKNGKQRTRARLIMAYDRERGLFRQQGERKFQGELVPSVALPSWRHSLMIQPLFFDDEPLGYCSLELGPEDGSVYEFVGELLSTALKAGELTRTIAEEAMKRERAERARLAQELEIAARIQTGILPKHRHVSGLELASTMLPADEVGGDYFDILPIENGCWLAIGDVAGHGLKTGLVMLMIQSIVAATTHTRPTARPAEVWQALNHVLCDNVRERLAQDEHATLALLRYSVDGRIIHAGAHEDIIVYRQKTGGCELISTSGMWVGITQELPPDPTPEAEIQLERGDILVLYTDGIVEAMDRERNQFGIKRLCQIIEHVAHEPADRICEAINRNVLAHMHQQSDDLTLLVGRYLGNP